MTAKKVVDEGLSEDPEFLAVFADAKEHERLIQYSLPEPGEEPEDTGPPLRVVNVITPHLMLGGAERQTVELAIGLYKLGWGVTLTVKDMTDACSWFLEPLDRYPDINVQQEENPEADAYIWWGIAKGPLGAIYVNHSPNGPFPKGVRKVINVWGEDGIPNGIDPDPYLAIQPSPNRLPLRVGMLGRLDPNKGVQRALYALAETKDCILLVAGEGNPSDLAMPGSLEGRVTFTGPMRPDLFFSSIDVLLNCSDNEGMPITAIEAAMSRRCIVHTGAGDLPRHFPDGERGFQVAPGPKALGQRLQVLANFPEMMNLPVDRAFEYAMENLTDEKMAQAYSNELLDVVKYKVLCLADQPGWAHARGHEDCASYTTDDLKVHVHVIRDWPEVPLPPHEDYDVVFTPYTRTGGAWACLKTIPKSKMVAAMRSSEYDYNNLGCKPPQSFIRMVNSYKAFQTVTRRNYLELLPHCPNVVHLPNPCNLDKFPNQTKVEGVVACWSGNTGRFYRGHTESIKGFDEYVYPACELAGVPLNTKFYSRDPSERTDHEDMNDWYCQSSVLVFPSTFEGCSKTILEAMASGLVIVGTPVGTLREMQDNQIREFGETGIIIVERDIGQIAEVLQRLRDKASEDMDYLGYLGRLNRREVEERWSWDIWAPKYVEFLKMGVNHA